MFFKRQLCHNRVFFLRVCEKTEYLNTAGFRSLYMILARLLQLSLVFKFYIGIVISIRFSTNWSVVLLPPASDNMYMEFITSGRYYLYVKFIFITYTERLLLFSRFSFIGASFIFFIILYESGTIVWGKTKTKTYGRYQR